LRLYGTRRATTFKGSHPILCREKERRKEKSKEEEREKR
jgi:hypothetical protein